MDLYYRLDVVSILIPPLRERKGDIPLLANHFLEKYKKEVRGNKKIKGLSEGALKVMLKYDWPGNVRELENSLERAVILTKGPLITPGDLPPPLQKISARKATRMKTAFGSLKEALQEPERETVLEALRQVDWNRKQAAALLKVNRTTLYNKIKRLGLEKEKRKG